MKRTSLLLLVLFVVAFAVSSWGVCPQDEYDYGECDTMHVEPWPEDLQYTPEQGPYFVRVPIYITHDMLDYEDSLAGFVVPLCYTHTNPSNYCSLSAWWHMTSPLWVVPGFATRSIFRHVVKGIDTLHHNRMADLAADFLGREWDTIILHLASDSSWYVYDVDDSTIVPAHFWLNMFPTGTQDQRFWEGSRTLLATLTFKMQDSMTVYIDTCFWPPSSHLVWIPQGHGTASYTPRSGTGTPSYLVSFGLGGNEVREVRNSDETKPAEFSLSQNYPNPFNPVTNFRFTLAKSAHVRIDIFNIVGQRVKTLVDEEMKAGVYAADWDGKDDRGKSVSSGVYFYRMQAGDFSDMKKMLLVK